MVCMKTISTILLAVLALTACAVDEEPQSGVPGVAASDVGITEVETDIDELDSGEWAEDIFVNDLPRTLIHRRDGRLERLD